LLLLSNGTETAVKTESAKSELGTRRCYGQQNNQT